MRKKISKNVVILRQERTNPVKNQDFPKKPRMLGAMVRNMWEIWKICIRGRPRMWKYARDACWEKRLRKQTAFGRPRDYIFKLWIIYLPRVKNYIADFYFSERNFEYVKNSLT